MANCPATTSKAKKKPGRKRRVAGWMLLVIGVLIAGVWGASRWWLFGSHTSWWNFELSRGELRFSPLSWHFVDGGASVRYGTLPGREGWTWTLLRPDPRGSAIPSTDINWGIARYQEFRGANHCLDVLLWPFALVSLLGGGWLMWSGRRARRRAMTDLCLKCRYDLSGHGAGSVCPECGEARGGGA